MLSVAANTLIHLDAALPYGSRLASVRRTGEDLQREELPTAIDWPRTSPDGTSLPSIGSMP